MADVEHAPDPDARLTVTGNGREWGDMRDRVLRVEIGLEHVLSQIGSQTTQIQAMDGKLDQVLEASAKRAGAFGLITTLFDGLGHAVWALLGGVIILIAQHYMHH